MPITVTRCWVCGGCGKVPDEQDPNKETKCMSCEDGHITERSKN